MQNDITNSFQSHITKKKFLTESEISSIFEKVKNMPLVKGSIYYGNSKKKFLMTSQRKTDVAFIRMRKIEKKAISFAQKTNAKYWKYRGLKTASTPQLARYQKSHKFKWHVDFPFWTIIDKKARKDRVLTMVILLNDSKEFNGGHLQLIDLDGQKHTLALKQKGDMALFPSILFHQVTPILSGERNTLIIWLKAIPDLHWLIFRDSGIKNTKELIGKR